MTWPHRKILDIRLMAVSKMQQNVTGETSKMQQYAMEETSQYPVYRTTALLLLAQHSSLSADCSREQCESGIELRL